MKTFHDLDPQTWQALVEEGQKKVARCRLSREDREDILGEALLAVFSLSPGSPTEEVVLCFRKTLDEGRKSLTAEQRRAYPYKPEDEARAAWKAFSQLDSPESSDTEFEELLMEKYMLDVVKDFQGFLKTAFDMQSPKDRALLGEAYTFEKVGLLYDPTLLSGLSQGAKKQALWRARGKFLQALEDVLLDAVQDPNQDPKRLLDLLKLISSGLLGDVVAVCRHRFGKASDD
jgi:hypothetical protein